MSTRKRILFVDDEPMVLQGLQRMLHGWRHEWDMEFVDSAARAIERANQAHFDVVVSDMRMPGMNGAELLGEIMRRHPKTVRIILSGHADQELILKCVGSTHQYLSKPCDPEALKAVVLRATELDTHLASEQLRQLASGLDRVPCIPSLYTKLVERLQDPEASAEAIGQLVARDIGMTAQILRLVNSAFFGLRREVSHPVEAVTFLGLDTIKSLVLSVNVFAQFEPVRCRELSFEALWGHSLATGICARAIARCEAADAKVADEAFVAGLLHDVGRLVLATNLCGQYSEAMAAARAEKVASCVTERRAFNATHAEVGGYLLGLWGLPVPVVEAITWHHEPGRTAERGFIPLAAVHAANAIIQEGRPRSDGTIPPALDIDYLDRLGLGGHVLAWRDLCRGLLDGVDRL